MKQGREVELWKAAPDFEGFYEVSSFGRVRSLHTRFKSPRPCSLGTDSEGYPTVSLSKNGHRTTRTVHRLVCRAFHGEPKLIWNEVGHRDNDRKNARLDNLRWVCKVENRADRKAHGTHDAGERSPNAKLTADAVREIRSFPPYKINMNDLARRFGVSRHTIDSARRGQNWEHVAPATIAASQ